MLLDAKIKSHNRVIIPTIQTSPPHLHPHRYHCRGNSNSPENHLVVVAMKEDDQNSERCKIESAVMDDEDVEDDEDDVADDKEVMDDDDDDARLGSASNCISSFIMLKACAS